MDISHQGDKKYGRFPQPGEPRKEQYKYEAESKEAVWLKNQRECYKQRKAELSHCPQNAVSPHLRYEVNK